MLNTNYQQQISLFHSVKSLQRCDESRKKMPLLQVTAGLISIHSALIFRSGTDLISLLILLFLGESLQKKPHEIWQECSSCK